MVVKNSKREVELVFWQFVALFILAFACILGIVPLARQFQLNRCADNIQTDKPKRSTPELFNFPSVYHAQRYVRDVNSQDQCGDVPPQCPAASSTSATSIAGLTTTRRSTVSTVSVTRPPITNIQTDAPTTTPDPWANSSQLYTSWRLPLFATPVAYTLSINCPTCFDIESNSSVVEFSGRTTIDISLQSAQTYLVLHSKNLLISQASLIAGGTGTANVTYLPKYDMIYLAFAAPIAAGAITLQIDYTGTINTNDNNGFYRESFWKSIGELRYVLAGNFQPIHARRAFPCFDEPNMSATFKLTLEHDTTTTVALSNMPVATTGATSTTFEITPSISTYRLAWAILPQDGFRATTRDLPNTKVNIWTRSSLSSATNINSNSALTAIQNGIEFVVNYFNVSSTSIPSKIDFIAIPDLILDEKASSSWGLLTFREEFLITDTNLNSAEREQSSTKIIIDQIIQMWTPEFNWWNSVWYGKSLASFLAYKAVEQYYPTFGLMEQFATREIVPIMMDDGKPSTLPVSNGNLSSNEQIIDALAPNLYAKGAAILRIVERIVGEEDFQMAVTQTVNIDDVTGPLYLTQILNTTVTVEQFLRSWLDEQNYPKVTINMVLNNGSAIDTTVTFQQQRYIAAALFNDIGLNPNYRWKIYLECQFGGFYDNTTFNLTGNIEPTLYTFLFDTPEETIVLPNTQYTWIKCNKDFYSYQVTEYVGTGDDEKQLWYYFEQLFNTDAFSNVDKANLINDAFILSHGGEIVTYDQAVELVRELNSGALPPYVPWATFVWHWYSLMGIEEHSQYFRNFKVFATQQSYGSGNMEIEDLVITGTNHRERLFKSLAFELLCRVQDTSALNKATELFGGIPSSFFSDSTGVTNIGADYLAVVIQYHLQNSNNIDQWDQIWTSLTENQLISPQQRIAFLRALGASKEIWRIKLLLEQGLDTADNEVNSQDFFDVIVSISQNPIGRDILWNFYRHNYNDLIVRFGLTNRPFNQLIINIVQSFENEFFYFEMVNFKERYPSPSNSQQVALDQVIMNFEWLYDTAVELDNAISIDPIVRK